MSKLKYFTLLTILSTQFALATSGLAMSGEGCGGDCASCHALSLQEANTLLKNIGTVTSVKPAAVRGLYEVVVGRDGKSAVAYLDYGKKHLIAGQVISLQQVAAEAAVPVVKTPERIDPAILSTANSIVMGNPKGKKRLFVFTDPDCPFCAKLHHELKLLVAGDKEVAVFVKLLPLPMHPHSYDKSRVILGEKSLALLDRAFAGGKIPAPGKKHAGTGVDAVKKFAQSVGINSTPTMVFPDGRLSVGTSDAGAIAKLLAAAK